MNFKIGDRVYCDGQFPVILSARDYVGSDFAVAGIITDSQYLGPGEIIGEDEDGQLEVKFASGVAWLEKNELRFPSKLEQVLK